MNNLEKTVNNLRRVRDTSHKIKDKFNPKRPDEFIADLFGEEKSLYSIYDLLGKEFPSFYERGNTDAKMYILAPFWCELYPTYEDFIYRVSSLVDYVEREGELLADFDPMNGCKIALF